jgi:hypothetical protein
MKLYATAARVFEIVFEEDPSFKEDLGCRCLYNASCAALLASVGSGADADSLTQAERDAWRRQALQWLESDLAFLTAQHDAGDEPKKKQIRDILAFWKEDPDLLSIRDPASLAALPDGERASWEELWLQVEEFLKS